MFRIISATFPVVLHGPASRVIVIVVNHRRLAILSLYSKLLSLSGNFLELMLISTLVESWYSKSFRTLRFILNPITKNIIVYIYTLTVSFCHNSSICLDTQYTSNWDRNKANFTSVRYFTPNYRSSQSKRRNFTYIFIYMYVNWLPEWTIHEKSFAFTRMW